MARRFAKSFLSALVRPLRYKHFIPLCLTASVTIRILWIALIFSIPVSDFAWYHQRGQDMAMGKGYSVDGVPTAYWPVGYPAFLGLIYWVLGLSLLYVKLANVLLYVGILCLSYSISKQLFSSELTGRMTLLLLAFYPNHVAYSSLVSPETLFLFLLLLGTALIMQSERRLPMATASGVVFGLACLVKPQAIFIPLILILTLHSQMRRDSARRFLAIFLTVHAALGATILPWIARNYSVFGSFVFISNNGGTTLLIGNNPDANGTYIHFDEKLASLLELEPDDNEREVDVKARNYALRYILEHPVKTIRLWPVKLYYLYNEDVEGANWNNGAVKIWERSHRPSSEIFFWWFIGLSQNYYICTMAAFVISLLVLFKERRNGSRALPTAGLWIIGYFTLVYMVTIGISRFHFPFIPWILMYVSWLMERAASRLSISLTGVAHAPPDLGAA